MEQEAALQVAARSAQALGLPGESDRMPLDPLQ
jgi:hypothetical protein